MNANIVNCNIRGAWDATKRAIINEALLRSKPNVVVLQETKKEVITQSFCRELWNKNGIQFCYVPSQGASGGMCIMWCEDEFELLDTLEDQYTLSCMFKSRRDGTEWFVTGVYAPNNRVQRKKLWREIAGVLGVWDIPGCVVGDFNTIRFVEEKNRDIAANRGMTEFSNFISDCDLIDLPLYGAHYTWSNFQEDPICCRLDRMLVNIKWEELFPDNTQSARPRPISDHCPL